MTPAAGRSSRQLFGHPIGLTILFLTAMWEMFSFHGLRTLLVYYMVEHLSMDQALASQIFGLYMAAAYLTPLAGGLIADRFLGERRAMIGGCLLIAVGQFFLPVRSLFLPSLCVIACGNGLFKPTASTQVGALYELADERRDRAFGLFYVGINVGALIAPLICGTLGELYSWRLGFGVASIGMLLGLALYLSCRRYLPPDLGSRESGAAVPKPAGAARNARVLWGVVCIALFTVLFWAAYGQTFNTVAIWALDDANRVVRMGSWSFTIPATWIQSMNPLLIIVLMPILNVWWRHLARAGREPDAVRKIVIGCYLLGLGFVALAIGAAGGTVLSKPSWLWLFVFSVFQTLGELYLSPVGQSLFNRVAPAGMASFVMGIWFLNHTVGNYLSGLLGTYWDATSPAVYFALMAAISALGGLGIFLTSASLRNALTTAAAPAMARDVEGG